MKIDAYCHIIPRTFLRSYVKTQIPQLLRFAEAEVGTEDAYFVDDDLRVKHMDKFGIDKQVISFNPPIWETIPESDLLRVTRLTNDAFAEIVKKHPDRFVGIASIPIPEGEQLDEVDRCINDLGLKGCIIFSNIRGRPLDSPEFMPFYEKMAKYDLPIFIHPTTWKYYDWIYDYRMIQIFGWPFDTSLAVGRLVFGGVLDRLPNLKFVVHHMGAMVSFFSERIKGFYDEAIMHSHVYGSHYFPHAKTMKKHPIEYFKSLYADTVALGSVPALKCGLDFFGIDHMLYGTDYPFGPEKGQRWTKDITRSVDELGLSEVDTRKIYYENAKRILKL